MVAPLKAVLSLYDTVRQFDYKGFNKVHRKTPSLVLLVSLLTLFCAEVRLTAGQIWAWGDNSYGQLNVSPDLTNVTAVSAGYRHALALTSDGRVIAWGDNTLGQTNVPPTVTNAVAVSAGGTMSLALRADGTVVAWGDNSAFQLNVPQTLSGVIAISAGGSACLALRADNTVVAWGDNTPQQLDVPPDLTNAVAVSAGNAFCIALRADGTLKGWGNNRCQGGGPTQYGGIPVPNDLTNVLAISAADHHVLALLANGTVRAFGCEWYGETNVPPDLTNAVAVSAGFFSSYALKSDGIVVAWGQNTNLPAGLLGVTAISAGQLSEFHMALASAQQARVAIDFASPVSQTISVGSEAFFSVSASSAAPVTYQWYFGTNALAGATNKYLALYNVQVMQSGTYTVVVTNAYGSATSQPLTLSVVPSLEIFAAPALSLKGAVGSSLRIDYINAIGPTNTWTPLTTVTLTNTQQFYSDLSAIGQPIRLYRLVQLP